MEENKLVRSNKITAFWQGEGVAVGIFYRTHDKIKEVHSNDPEVQNAGFTFPEGTDEAPVTAQDKLSAFKTFLCVNATTFGIQYDPVDRRADEFKFPSKYDEDTFTEYSKKMAEKAITDTLDKVQNNIVNKMVEQGHLPEGTEIDLGIGEPTIAVKESYKNGNIKYADAVYPVVIQIADKRVETVCTVSAISGQLKKPRELSDGVVLTQTSIKNLLVENGLLPKIEKPKPEPTEVEDNGGEEGTDAEMPTADDYDE